MAQVVEIKELLKGVELLGISAKKIAKDHKVDLNDLPVVIDLAKNAGVLADAAKGLDQIPAEIKDLDQAEILELVSALFATIKAIKEA